MNRTPRLEDRRERLIQAAAELFYDHGYERTSVRQLAESVGILSGSVFHHFASKEDILLAVMTTTINAMTKRLRAASTASNNNCERLLGLIRTELELLHGVTRHGVAVTFFQWHSLGEANQQHVLALRADYEKIWLDVLGKAHASGSIHTDPFITRRLLTGANGWTIYWYQPGGQLDLDALAAEIRTLLTGPTNQRR